MAAAATVAAALLAGCASPGQPRPPSLRLPGPVRSLTAERVGDAVTVHFTLPERTTDGEGLRDAALTPVLCRGEMAAPCLPEPPAPPIALPKPAGAGQHPPASVEDHLPPALASGPLRAMQYRVELLNGRGRTAGFGQPILAAAGAAPPPVAELSVRGTRLGPLITWAPAPGDTGEVIVQRVALPAGKETLLRADAFAAAGPHDAMLDTTADDGVAYRYSAFRERTIAAAGTKLSARSPSSPPVEFTLHDIFPPPVPTGLTAAPYTTAAAANAPAQFAVDLIWQPVEDPGLAGYNVYRVATATGETKKLTPQPVSAPAFHDATAQPGVAYRYRVTAIDRKGNESAAATVDVAP